MLIAAALVPVPPLLVPEVAGGSADRDADLRAACLDVVRALAGAERIVVIGAAPETRAYAGSWDFRPWGVQHPAEPAPARLPLALAIGAWLLDKTGSTSPRTYQGVSARLPRPRAVELGAALVGDVPTALLVCGDGSARRDEKAPGHHDPRAEGFDAQVESTVRNADPAALLTLDPMLAERLLVDGLASWQVLAGAATSGSWTAQVPYSAAPYGVGYLAAIWLPAQPIASIAPRSTAATACRSPTTVL